MAAPFRYPLGATLFALALAPCCSAPVLAQPAEAAYPVKAVRFLVGQSPGGATDLVARALAQKMSETLGSPVVVENRTGAAGSIAAALIAKMPPDGYNVLIVSSSYSINPGLYGNLPFDPVRDFAPITLIAEAPFLLVVHPSMPVRNARELVALARARPGALNYASGGIGSSGHMAGELFTSLAGIRMTHVPYKGAGPALVDVIAGQVHLTFGSVISSLGYVKSGRLKALAVTSAGRSRALPELPTVAESAVKGYGTTTWYAALAPAGTRAAVVQKLNAEIRKALAAPEVGQRFMSEGAEPVGNSPEQLRQHLVAEIEKWRKVVTAAGVRVD